MTTWAPFGAVNAYWRHRRRLDLTRAIWSPHSVNKTLQIQGFDANFGATYTVFVTANGTQLGTFTESSAWQDGGIQNNLRVPPGPTTFTSFTSPGSSHRQGQPGRVGHDPQPP